MKGKLGTEKQDSNLLILDCSALTYAAYYTHGTLSYSGKPTGVIYGFLKQVLTLARKFNTNRFLFCFDAGYSMRVNAYPEYKANRDKKRKEYTPSEKKSYDSLLYQTIALNHEILPNLGFKNCYIQTLFEADDLIAVLCERLRYKGLIVVSDDADLYQLLDKCDMYLPKRKKLFTEKDLKRDFGVLAKDWALAKAIGGCEGDNVKGIVGVSDPKKKTSKALKYLKNDLNKGVIFDRITSNEGKEIIARNLELVKLPYMPQLIKRTIFRRDTFARQRFIRVFDKYHFKSFLKNENFEQWEEIFLRG